MTRQQSNHFVSRPILVAGFGRLLARLPSDVSRPSGSRSGSARSPRCSGSSRITSPSSARTRTSSAPR